MAVTKDNIRITLTLPKEVLSHIDEHIRTQYLTRTKWFIEAAKDRVEKEKKITLERIIKGEIK